MGYLSSGGVSAHEFRQWDENSTLQIDSWGIFEMAVAKGYRAAVPDVLLAQFAEAVKIGGPVFENVSTLLALCDIPLTAERLPMYAGAVSLSP